eukprot:jgi/Botrbrau1/21136/Bobra.0061s0030.1
MSKRAVQALFLGGFFLLARGQSVSVESQVADLLKGTDLSSFGQFLKGLNPASPSPNCQAGSKFTGTVDPKDPACFFLSICNKPGFSVRGCCAAGKVFVDPTPTNPLGTCVLSSGSSGPPSPPPPPPGVQCGNVSTFINVRWFGNGFCNVFAISTGTQDGSKNCTSNIFGKNCTRYPGALILTALNTDGLSAQNYSVPNFQSTLVALGLGNLETVGSVEFQASDEVPVALNPIFLPKLQTAEGFAVFGRVVDEQNGTRSATPQAALPAAPAGAQTGIQSVPSAVSLLRINSLRLDSTTMRNLTSFSNLRSLSNLTLYGNDYLQSTTGLENVTTVPLPEFQRVVLINNDALNTSASLRGLSNLLGCGGNTSSSAQVLISDVCPRNLTTPAAACAFIASSSCPVFPPPAPRYPPPPNATQGPPPPLAPSPPPQPEVQCGNVNTSITVAAYGNATCRVSASETGIQDGYFFGQCTSNIFGKNCTRYPGGLYIRAPNDNGLTSQNYAVPNFQSYLVTLGLGDLVTVGKVEFTSIKVPVALNLIFLPKLQTAGSYTLESSNGYQSPANPQTGIQSVPSAASLLQTDFLVITTTIMRNLTSFSNLRSLGTLTLYGNSRLQSTAGLENVANVTRVRRVELQQNPALNTSSSLQGLSNLLGCGANTSSSARVLISDACPGNLTTPAQACTFIASGICTLAPPSPPPRSPPPHQRCYPPPPPQSLPPCPPRWARPLHLSPIPAALPPPPLLECVAMLASPSMCGTMGTARVPPANSQAQVA